MTVSAASSGIRNSRFSLRLGQVSKLAAPYQDVGIISHVFQILYARQFRCALSAGVLPLNSDVTKGKVICQMPILLLWVPINVLAIGNITVMDEHDDCKPPRRAKVTRRTSCRTPGEPEK